MSDFGHLSDEIDAYSNHASGLPEGTHYIHDNRLFIWRDGVKGLEQRIAELEKDYEVALNRIIYLETINEHQYEDCVDQVANIDELNAENKRLQEQLQEQAKLLAYYRNKDV